uniref:Uncharacterized protein n=1 Tax=Arundo donax TaxID=35708 RepID=A0A0A9AAD9_ARUDO
MNELFGIYFAQLSYKRLSTVFYCITCQGQ